ncbi:methyl-accepting chemotaxis protein [Consotaella aegiceratis]|uniref:methyl-accepting chemotaxis protein n=1 Tax=Consotaella aegiceratis TaxID=3097961 RepID=UPI002F40C4BA
MTISRRILLLVAVPVIAIAALVGWIVADTWATSRAMARLSNDQEILVHLIDMTSALQKERGRSAQYLASASADFLSQVQEQRVATDARIAEFREASALESTFSSSPVLQSKLAEIDAAIGEALPKSRQATDERTMLLESATKGYDSVIDAAINAMSLLGTTVEQPEIRAMVVALDHLESAGEQVGRMGTFGASVLTKGMLGRSDTVTLAKLKGAEDQSLEQFYQTAPADLTDGLQDGLTGASGANAQFLYQRVVFLPPGQKIEGIDGAEWFDAMTQRADFLASFAKSSVAGRMPEAVEAVRAGAAEDLRLSVLVGGGLIVVLMALGYVTGRSITRPLGRITEVIKQLAAGDNEIEIPGTDRRDEVGEIAKAVGTFKEAALERDLLTAEAEEARTQQSRQRERQERFDRAKAEDLRSFVGLVEVSFERLSAGDLTVRMTEPVADEFEPIRAKFNDSVEKLEEAVGEVVASVTSIQAGLSEISAASGDLAQRTERQAVHLEETAAALSKVTETVGQTAEHSRAAQDVSIQAREKAESGGHIVAKAVDAMHRIESSSHQIGTIISVIDEIAFQTNLLALNAGVEAARAGEAGKGFAVVAQEVRALAQRSAEAAKEIKGLVATSEGEVRSGVALVTESGDALQDIVSGVASMAATIAAIADSARDQAINLREVSASADEMDKVTQQNAAMVEETTAAARSLADETEDLATTMARFRTRPYERTQRDGDLEDADFAMEEEASSGLSATAPAGSRVIPLRRPSGRVTAAVAMAAPGEDWSRF